MSAIEEGINKAAETIEKYGFTLLCAGKLREHIAETANAYAAEELEKISKELMSEAIIKGLEVEGMAIEDHDWPDAFATWSTLKYAQTKLDNRIKELRGKE